MKTIICFIYFCFIVTIGLFAQVPEALHQKITGKKKLADIMQEVEKYYADIKKNEPNNQDKDQDKDCPACKENDEAYMHWKRWEYFYKGRLNDAGEIINVAAKNYEAFTEYKNQQRSLANAAQITVFNPNWTFVGPDNITNINNNTIFTGVARANAITFHPTDPNKMWASTSSGGLFETSNGGTSWTCISNTISSLGIADMVVDYNNTNIMYVITGDGESNNGSNWFVEAYGYLRYSTGVLKSQDGGVTWQQTGLIFPSTAFRAGFKLSMHPTNSNILIAATNLGLYRTIDGGANWTLVQASVAGATNGFYDVQFKPNNANIVYATGRENDCAFFCSTDAGATWNSTSTTGLPTFGKRLAMEIPPSSSDSVYVLTGASTSLNQYKGMYRGKYNSVNNTISFSLIHNSPNIISIAGDGLSDSRNATEYDLTMAINSNHVVTGATYCWHSLNYGNAFVGAGTNLHADIHELDYNPLNGILYAACDGGIYKSTDNGVSFSCISQGLGATQIYHIADFEPDIAKLLIGTQDNGTNYKNSLSSNFRNIGGCDGFDVAFHPTVFDSCMFVCNTTIYASDNGGVSNYALNPPGHAAWYSTVGFNNTTNSIRYVGAEDRFYRTANKGVNWTSTFGVRGNTALQICPTSNRIYTAGAVVVNAFNNSATLYRIDNDCVTFTNLTTKPGMPSFGDNKRYVTSIATLPSNNDDVWISICGYADGIKVFHSINAGLNWQNESKNLPNVPVNAIAIDANGNIYIGNDFGVFARRATDNDWFPFYNDLPNVPVTDIAINDLQSKLTISTFGRGVWRANALSTTCPTSLIIQGTYNGQYSYQAADFINATANVVNSSGSKLNINAGNYINLNVGFMANAGSIFKAQIAPCGPVSVAKNMQETKKIKDTPKEKK